jgi:hypothetical protein
VQSGEPVSGTGVEVMFKSAAPGQGRQGVGTYDRGRAATCACTATCGSTRSRSLSRRAVHRRPAIAAATHGQLPGCCIGLAAQKEGGDGYESSQREEGKSSNLRRKTGPHHEGARQTGRRRSCRRDASMRQWLRVQSPIRSPTPRALRSQLAAPAIPNSAKGVGSAVAHRQWRRRRRGRAALLQ